MRAYLEGVDDDRLWRGTIEQFYVDRVRFGTSTQLALLHARRTIAQEAFNFPGSAVIDRTYWADRFVFVPTLEDDGLPSDEVCMLEKEYEKFRGVFPPVDLLLLLTCKPDTAYKRLLERDRPLERTTDLAVETIGEDHYLSKIGKRYGMLPDVLAEKGVYAGPCIVIDQEDFSLTDGRHVTALLEEMALALGIEIR